MRRRNKFHLFCAAFLLLLGATVPAYPCRCKPASLKTSYKQAEAVVTAKVISVSTNENQVTTALLQVDRVWKKDVPVQIEVITESTCAYSFQEGTEYLLYLLSTPSGKLATSRCAGNLLLSESEKSQNWLDKNGKKMQVLTSQKFEFADLFKQPVAFGEFEMFFG